MNFIKIIKTKYKNAWAIIADGEILYPLFKTKKEARQKWEKKKQGQIKKIEIIIK